ncbi:MAG: hypothetical protein ABI877_20980, partial [Gemmatimonadaceae bacterium]
TDLFLAGNDFGFPPNQGRYDASYGLLLRGAGNGQFAAVDLEQSHIAIEGQVRHMVKLHQGKDSTMIVVAKNNGALQLLRPRR